MFNYTKETYKKDHNDVLTQFGYACRQLGVSISTTSVSQSKGQVERANGTFQGRLVNELRMNGIDDIESANIYLISTFLPFYTKRFALSFKDFPSIFEKSPDDTRINYTLSVLSPRKFDSGCALKYLNHYYQAYDEQGELRCFAPKTECMVIRAFDNSLLVSVDDKVYALRECRKHLSVSEEFDNEIPKAQKKKIYIPPMSHPWKRASFIAHQQNAHRNHIYA